MSSSLLLPSIPSRRLRRSRPGRALLAAVAAAVMAFAWTPDAAAQSRCEDAIRVEIRDAAAVVEPASGAVPARFSIVLSRQPDSSSDPLCDVVVSWRTLDGQGTATVGADYQRGAGIVFLGEGETEVVVPVVVFADDQVEDDETFFVGIEEARSETQRPPQVSRSRARGLILDGDAPSALEPVGGNTVVVDAGDEAELAVRVLGPDGGPVPGTVVLWRITGGEGTFGGDGTSATSVSDDQGVARQSVVPSPRPGVLRVEASLGEGVSVQFEITVEGDLEDLFTSSSPGQQSLAGVLDDACVEATGQFGSFCGYLFGLTSSGQRSVINQATPREVAGQGNVTLQAAHNQFDYLETRLEALRAGTSAVQTRVSVLFDDAQIQLADLGRGIARHKEEEAWLQDRVERAVALAEMRMQDEGGEGGGAYDLEDEIESPSRLGLFVSGRISVGDREGTNREEGFEVDVRGLTAGLDYRMTGSFVAGAAVSYLDTQVDLANDGGGMDGGSWSLAAYGTWFGDSAYLEGVLSYGRNDLEQTRNVDLPSEFQGLRRWVARADVEGDQVAATVTAGYDHSFGAASVEGFVRGSWVDATLDPYVEQGGGPFDLVVQEQSVESLLGEVGTSLTYAASFGWGVLQPTLTASYLHEFEDDVRLIRGRFVEDVQALEFVIPTEVRDPDFFNVGGGLTAVTPGGRSFYVFYDRDLEREGLAMETWSFGLRLEF